MLIALIAYSHLLMGSKMVSLPLPELKTSTGFADQSKEESSKFLASTIRSVLEADIESNGVEVRPLEGSTGAVDADIQITLLSFKQRNRSNEELINSPGKGGSETSVEVSMTLTQGTDKQTFAKLKGKVSGSFFGTTDKSDMSGSPMDKAVLIKVVNTQRAKAIARAIWDAIRPTLTGSFGWKAKEF